MNTSSKEIMKFIDGFVNVQAEETSIEQDYSTKIVAFIDILGVRNLMKGSHPSNYVITKMNDFYKIVDSECKSKNYENDKMYDWVIMGDGAAIISNNNNLDELLNTVMNIQIQVLLNLKMALRGAITAGKVTVLNDGKVIIGPAFVEAFELESEVAIYPRIIISCDAMSKFEEYNCQFKYLTKDFDKNFVIDFVKALRVIDRNFSKTQSLINEILEEKLCDEKVKNNCKLIQKYGWLANFVNRNDFERSELNGK